MSNSTLRELFTKIRDERETHANTANRIGSAFLALLDKFDNSPYIHKDKEDVDPYLLTLLQGVVFGDNGENYVNGDGDAKLSDVIVDRIHDKNSTPSERVIIGAQGFDFYMGDDGKSHLYVDYLTARTRMFASSVEIRKVSYSGGTTIFSNAGSQIAKVSYIYDAAKEKVIAYKCYAVADDGTTKTMNWWHVGMMALCQTFNVKAGEAENLSNRYYWRMVVGVGQEKIDGKLYDYVILSNVKEFQGNLLTIPTFSYKTLGDEQSRKLVWGDVMVDITLDEGMRTLASLFLEQEGKDVDDNGNKIADRIFYGYDGDEPDAPAPFDVIVQVGDQIQWKKYGNVIKLSTSTEDNATDNAPAITMYHKLGAPHYTGKLDANGNKIVNPYQWKIITTIISPEKVMHNTDNFQLFQGTPDNIVDPITIMYDIVPSVTYYTRHPSTQTTTPSDITFTLHKRTGNKIETLGDAQIYAEYSLLDGSSATKLLPNKALSDIGNLYQITSVKLKSTIKEADHEDIVVTLDLPVLTDGVKGDQGAAGKDGINGTNGKDGIDGKDGKTPTVVSTTYQYAITATSTKPADSEWKSVMPDPSKYEGKFLWTKTTTTWSTGDKTDTFSCTYIGTDGADGTSVTIKGTLDSISELPTTGTAGDSYIIGGFLWVYAGTTTEDSNNHNGYTNVGKIKGEDGVSATQYYIHTAWMKALDGTGFTVANPNGDAYPYVGTLVDANVKDSTNWRDYKWTYVKGDKGKDGKTPTVVSTTYQYAITATSAKPADSEWKAVMPDPSKYEGKFLWTKTTTTWSTGDKTDTFSCTYIGTDGDAGTSVTIKGTLGSISELPTTGTAGDSYIIGGFLWVYAGTTTEDSNNHNGYTNVGKIKGEDGVSATQYYIHTAWMKALDGTGFTVANPNGDAYPYVGTLVDANEKDSTNWRDYKWTYVKGDTGSKGDKGDKGDQGLPGVDGAPGANGKDGVDGKDGEDAINIVVNSVPVVFNTENNGLVEDGAAGYASVYVYQKKENISSQVENIAVYSTENCKCEVAYDSEQNYLRVKISNVAKEDITVDGATTQISKTAGYATIQFSYNGVMYYQQVQFVVNVSKFNSSVIQTTKKYEQKYTEVSNQIDTLSTDVNNLDSNLGNLRNDVDSLDQQVEAIPLRSNQDLTTFESKITQTARNISLSLTEQAVSRRNLLVNSDFARNGGFYTTLVAKATMERLSGYKNSNCCHLMPTSTSQYPVLRWEGVNSACNNIPIVGGKKYTISCWAKVSNTAAPLYINVFGQEKITGNVTTGTILDKFVKLNSANTWQLVSFTFVAPGGYSYCSVRLSFRPKTNTRIDGYVCRPMFEQSDSYNGWTLSENDYDYRGGNMLDNTRYLNTGGNLSQVGTLTGNAKDGCSLSEATVQQNKSATLVRFDNVSVVANTDYVLSFFIRSKVLSSKTNVVCTLNLVTNAKFAECSSGSVSTWTSANGNSTTSGYIEFGNIPTEWTKVWYHFSAHNTVTNQAIAIQMYGRNGAGTLQICQPKLEAGLMNTPWTEATEDVANKDALKRTGIDIEKGKITLDADNTIITGDLHLKGVLIENSAEITYNLYQPIICDMVHHKSVTFRTWAKENNQATWLSGININPYVVLPMINDVVLSATDQHGELTVHRIKESGMKLSISSQYNPLVAKWATGKKYQYNDRYVMENQTGAPYEFLHRAVVVVFADPRLASVNNYNTGNTGRIHPQGGGVPPFFGDAKYDGGCFICNGRRSRMLFLMPGQSLHLTSSVERIGNRDVVVWYIDNSNDFAPISKTVTIYAQYINGSDGYKWSDGDKSFPDDMINGSVEYKYEDVLLAPPQLSATYPEQLPTEALGTDSVSEVPFEFNVY